MSHFKIVDIEQGSEQWYEWRSKAVTATAASILMGLHYLDKDEGFHEKLIHLWEEKTGQVEFYGENNAVVQHGKDTEDIARAEFIESTGVSVVPCCVINNDYPFIVASLDGINLDHKVGVEIKCPRYYASFKKHKSDLPDYYYAQIQHQMLVTGFKKWYYFSYFNNSDLLYEVHEDQSFQEELLKRSLLFKSIIDNKEDMRLNLDSFLQYKVSKLYR